MTRNTTIINFSAPPDLALQITQTAKQENVSKSRLLRQAFQTYLFDKKLTKLQEYGQVIAEKLGLETYDQIEQYIES